MISNFRKYFTPLNIIFGLEIIVALLASIGFIPREAVLIWTGLAIFYMIFSPVEDSLWLVAASIPLFAALPISDNFDTLANWRILVAVLFLVWFFKEKISLSALLKKELDSWRAKRWLSYGALEYLTIVFLLVAALSISVADYKILAIKKFLFLVNIFLLFLIVKYKTQSKKDILRIWRAVAVGGGVALGGAMAQFIGVIFVSLIDFWEFWAGRVINFFYGQGLSELLSYANTWFAYYKSAPPTLRLFSVFPDSHSFAMFCLMLVPVFSSLAFYYQEIKNRQALFSGLAGMALFGVVFSGSRGAWLSALPVLAGILFFWLKNLDKNLLKIAARGLVVFGVIFILSIGYPPLFYQIQAWQTGQYSSSTFYFFERARSISDLDEISNKGRLEIWRNSVESFKQRPWLGVGLGNFVSVINEEAAAAKKGASAHSLYLDIASEIGIPGLLILLAIFANILYTAWLVWRKAAEPYFKLFGLFLGLYFGWILSYSFFDVVLLNDKVLLFFMVNIAVLYSLRDIIFDIKKT